MKFDHIAISGRTLAEATTYVETALGVALQQGGQHDAFQTHNNLLGLEQGLYLEALAMMPGATDLEKPRMFGINTFDAPPRLTNWICRCDDIDAVLAALPETFGQPVTITRGDLRWRMAVPAKGALPFDNCAPGLIQWLTDVHPVDMLAPSACTLTHLTITHPEAGALQEMLAPLLNEPRVSFEEGAPAMRATFDTPTGAKILQ